MNKQQIKGATNEMTGGVKKQVGKMTGDRTLQAKGQARELKGKAQQGLGNAKEDVKTDRAMNSSTTRRTR
jgi:uncharacterized protein YjbJ (UPF0337 family)